MRLAVVGGNLNGTNPRYPMPNELATALYGYTEKFLPTADVRDAVSDAIDALASGDADTQLAALAKLTYVFADTSVEGLAVTLP